VLPHGHSPCRRSPAPRDSARREKLSDLFNFGPGTSSLFLAGSGDPNNPILQAHEAPLHPFVNAENASLSSFSLIARMRASAKITTGRPAAAK